jgi:hypothetical protein
VFLLTGKEQVVLLGCFHQWNGLAEDDPIDETNRLPLVTVVASVYLKL